MHTQQVHRQTTNPTTVLAKGKKKGPVEATPGSRRSKGGFGRSRGLSRGPKEEQALLRQSGGRRLLQSKTTHRKDKRRQELSAFEEPKRPEESKLKTEGAEAMQQSQLPGRGQVKMRALS